ncbi:LuxR C-terminal-related transcriptional regulator [Leifsonia sp. NPDC102414]|uniref:helix-turn-helix transcriptional regulator n=1 Tax=Leifsonia sp. NPDC102414 TaxID=3364124 RepID=UPI0038090187
MEKLVSAKADPDAESGDPAIASPVTVLVDNLDGRDENFLSRVLSIAQTQPGVRFVLASRYAPSLRQLDAASSIDLSLVRARDLMFRREEAREVIANIAGGHDISEVYLANIVLPLGARLIGVAVSRGNYGAFDWSGSGRALVAERLVRRIFEQIPDSDILDAAMRLSVSEQCDLNLCARLTGASDPSTVLDELERLGVGFHSVDASADQGFQIVPLLRQGFLRELARRRPNEVTELQRVTALWCLEQGRTAEAFRNTIAIQDLYFAARIARSDWARMSSVLLHQVGVALQAIDKRRIARFPALSILAGLSLSAVGRRGTADSHFEDALSALRRPGAGEPADVIWTLTFRSIARRELRQPAEAARNATRAFQETERLPREVRDELAPQLAALMADCAHSLLFNGATHAAGDVARLGLRYAVAATPQHDQLLVANALALALDGIPDYVDALDAIDPDAVGLTRDSPDLLTALCVIGSVESGEEPDEVQVNLLKSRSQTSTWWIAGWAAGLYHLGRGEGEAGAATVQRSLANLTGDSEGRRRSLRMLCFLLMAARQPGRADEVLAGLPRKDPETALLRSVRAAQSARFEEAIEEAALALSLPDDGHPRLTATAALTAAAAAQRLGLLELSDMYAVRGIAIVKHNRLRTPLLAWTPDHADQIGMRLPQDAGLSGVAPTHSWLDGPVACEPLTSRERAVLAALVETDSRAGLARALGVSINTVKTQLRSLYRKLGAGDRHTAILRALETGVLPQASAVRTLERGTITNKTSSLGPSV